MCESVRLPVCPCCDNHFNDNGERSWQMQLSTVRNISQVHTVWHAIVWRLTICCEFFPGSLSCLINTGFCLWSGGTDCGAFPLSLRGDCKRTTSTTMKTDMNLIIAMQYISTIWPFWSRISDSQNTLGVGIHVQEVPTENAFREDKCSFASHTEQKGLPNTC